MAVREMSGKGAMDILEWACATPSVTPRERLTLFERDLLDAIEDRPVGEEEVFKPPAWLQYYLRKG